MVVEKPKKEIKKERKKKKKVVLPKILLIGMRIKKVIGILLTQTRANKSYSPSQEFLGKLILLLPKPQKMGSKVPPPFITTSFC